MQRGAPTSTHGALRTSLLALAVLACALAWIALGKLLGHRAFTVHMSRHMLLVVILAPLLVLLLRCRGGSDAGSDSDSNGSRQPRAAGRLVALMGLVSASPLVASLLEMVVVWGWHLPAAHAAVRTSAVCFALEQLMFLAAGLALWASVLQPGAALAGAGGMLLTSMHMTLLGTLIVLSPGESGPASMSMPAHHAAMATDHQLGGLVMLGVGTPVYLVAGLWLVYRQLQVGDATMTAELTGSES